MAVTLLVILWAFLLTLGIVGGFLALCMIILGGRRDRERESLRQWVNRGESDVL